MEVMIEALPMAMKRQNNAQYARGLGVEKRKKEGRLQKKESLLEKIMLKPPEGEPNFLSLPW